VQNGLHEDALRLFQRSLREGVEFSEFTLSAILSTCASLALMMEGIQLHAVIFKYGFHGNFFVASSLVDVYARCGQIEEAYLIFSDMKHKNVVLSF
jgi:pentatricopeptide repeat protein